MQGPCILACVQPRGSAHASSHERQARVLARLLVREGTSDLAHMHDTWHAQRVVRGIGGWSAVTPCQAIDAQAARVKRNACWARVVVES